MSKVPSLYELLGITADALPDAIKKAWRREAARTHPDKRDGDREDFERAHHAYLVLRNPETRAEYDRTGVDPGVKVDNDQALLLQNINRLLQSFFSVGEAALARDIPKEMLRLLDAEDREDRQTLAKCDAQIAVLSKFAKRFRKKDRKSIGPNLFVMAIQGQINQWERAKENPQGNIDYRVKIREAIADYEFEIAPMLAATANAYAGAYGMAQRGSWGSGGNGL